MDNQRVVPIDRSARVTIARRPRGRGAHARVAILSEREAICSPTYPKGVGEDSMSRVPFAAPCGDALFINSDEGVKVFSEKGSDGETSTAERWRPLTAQINEAGGVRMCACISDAEGVVLADGSCMILSVSGPPEAARPVLPSTIVDIAGTDEHFAAVLATGAVAVWGTSGEVLENWLLPRSEPKRRLEPSELGATTVVANDSTFVVTTSGGAFSVHVSDGEEDHMGHWVEGSPKAFWQPAPLPEQRHVLQCAIGTDVCVAALEGGGICCFDRDHDPDPPEDVVDELRGGVYSVAKAPRNMAVGSPRELNADFCAVASSGKLVAWRWEFGENGICAVSLPLYEAQGRRFSSLHSNRAGSALCAVSDTGDVFTWGDEDSGGAVGESICEQLRSGIRTVAATSDAFSVLTECGSVWSWGDGDCGGEQRGAAALLRGGVVALVASDDAFAAAREDGSIVLWGGGARCSSDNNEDLRELEVWRHIVRV